MASTWFEIGICGAVDRDGGLVGDEFPTFTNDDNTSRLIRASVLVPIPISLSAGTSSV